MSNASLKEQLQAMSSQLAPKLNEASKSKSKHNKPKPKWLDQAHYGVELLKAYFPQCFKAPNEVKPLKKGIKQDLVKQLSTINTIVTEDKACMVKTLAYYVNTAAYHRCMKEGAVRVDLEGNPAGEVTVEEAKYSAERQQTKLQAKQAAASSSLQSKAKEEVIP